MINLNLLYIRMNVVGRRLASLDEVRDFSLHDLRVRISWEDSVEKGRDDSSNEERCG